MSRTVCDVAVADIFYLFGFNYLAPQIGYYFSFKPSLPNIQKNKDFFYLKTFNSLNMEQNILRKRILQKTESEKRLYVF